MLRIIREEEPPKPSTRLSRSGEPSRTDSAQDPARQAGPTSLASIAANRHTEPARLSKEVQGELDWIVMKALEKDRNRRYETASGFAADIERHLHDEPVEAGPPSAAYRLRKFVRREQGAGAGGRGGSARLGRRGHRHELGHGAGSTKARPARRNQREAGTQGPRRRASWR